MNIQRSVHFYLSMCKENSFLFSFLSLFLSFLLSSLLLNTHEINHVICHTHGLFSRTNLHLNLCSRRSQMSHIWTQGHPVLELDILTQHENISMGNPIFSLENLSQEIPVSNKWGVYCEDKQELWQFVRTIKSVERKSYEP